MHTAQRHCAVPLRAQGGEESSRRLLSEWFEAVDASELQPSCLISNHPRWASSQHPSQLRNEPFRSVFQALCFTIARFYKSSIYIPYRVQLLSTSLAY